MRHASSMASAVRSLGVALIVLGWCGLDWAQDVQLPKNRQGNRTAPILLLTRPEIRDELKLNPELAASARSLAGELQRKASTLRGKTGAGVLAARRAIDDEQTRWINKNLSPSQVDRLHQIDLQWEGLGVLVSRPIIAEYLNVTPQQRQAIAQLFAERDARLKQQGQKPPESDEAFSRRILANLSDQQQAQWNAMQGKPFRFLADPQADARRTQPAQSDATRLR